MIVIWDNRKNKYVENIVRRLVSGRVETWTTTSIKKAFKFNTMDKKKLEDWENALGYKHGELEYKEI